MTTLTSPVGTIVHMNLDEARDNYSKTRKEFSIRLMFDGNTPEGAEYKKQVAAVNANKVVTSSKSVEIPSGYYIVSAWSIYKPDVRDDSGTKVEELPYFSKGSTGRAVMVTKPFEGSKGNGLNLQGVVILELDTADAAPRENQTEKSLLEAISKIKKS